MGFNCLFLSVLTTSIILVISFVRLLFSLDDVPGVYTTYFGAIMIEIIDDSPDWEVGFIARINFEQMYSVWLTIILVFIVFYGCGWIYTKYKDRQALKS